MNSIYNKFKPAADFDGTGSNVLFSLTDKLNSKEVMALKRPGTEQTRNLKFTTKVNN